MGSTSLIRDISDTVTPQGVVALIPRPFSPSIPAKPSLVLLLDSISDPGNMGTLIRTAAACGVDVMLTFGGCDVWSPKALRSGMGATFKMAIVEMNTWKGKNNHHPPPLNTASPNQSCGYGSLPSCQSQLLLVAHGWWCRDRVLVVAIMAAPAGVCSGWEPVTPLQDVLPSGLVLAFGVGSGQ